jgi:uracil-DNA glycosylase
MDTPKKIEALDQIAQVIKKCTLCPLYQGTENSVPGEGNPNTDIMFIGEAPGANEDRLGRPFVGRAGQLLETSLHEIGLTRSDVWIGNMIKHRPPDNRDPLPHELNSCKTHLDQQLKIINPKYLITLGRFAMEKFVSGIFISHVHGQAFPVEWEGNQFLLFPMYHPAAALRNPKMMQDFKADFIKLKDLLNPKSHKPIIKEPEKEPEITQLNLLSI